MFISILLGIGVLFAFFGWLAYSETKTKCKRWENTTKLETEFQVIFPFANCVTKIGDEWTPLDKAVKILRDGKLVWDIDRR